MKRLNIQYGDAFWNQTEMTQMKANYPKSIKPFYRFMDRNCIANFEFE